MASIPWKSILDYLAEVGVERELQPLCWKALTELERLVPFDSGALHMTNDAREILPGTRGLRLPRKAYDECVGYYMHLNPARLGLPRGVKTSGISWRRDFPDLEITTDYLESLGIRSSAGAFLYDAAGGLFAFLSINRSSTAGFSEREMTLLALVQGHLTNLLAGYTTSGALDSYTPAELSESCRLLSRREAEAARLYCRRLTATQIGSLLQISARTVEQHVQSIYRKLGVHGRQELARRLLGAGDDGGDSSRPRRPKAQRRVA